MKAKLDFKSKRTIIIAAIIAALAVGAGIGGYFYAKGNNEASATTNVSDGGQTTTEQPSGNNNQGTPDSNANNGNGNGGTTTPTDGATGDNAGNNGAANDGTNADGNAGNAGNGAAGNAGGAANNGAAGNAGGAGAGNAGNGAAGDNDGGDATTTTENIVVEEPWESHETSWRPEALNVSTPDINVKDNKIDVEKTSTTSTGNKSVSVGDTITYTITVTNNNTETLNSLYISDEIPEGTTFESIENGGETIKEKDVVKKVYWNLWNLGIEAGKTYSVSFKVTVNKDAKGTIKNAALVEKNKTNETKDPVIKSNKTASLVEIVKDEDGKETEKVSDLKDKTVKEGQIIRYTITVENTSKDEKATTKVSDNVPEGTTLEGEDGEEITVVNGKKTTTYAIEKLAEGINITIAEEGKVTISFDVKVNKDTQKYIKNIATVGSETPTTENEVYTDIEVSKTWDDADDQDGKRPEKITVVLNKTVGEETEKVDEVEITARKEWKYTFKDLPKYDGENEITYSVEETKVKDYETKIDGFNIINKHTPEVTEAVVNKKWDDEENQDGKRPGNITVTLNKKVGENREIKVKDVTLNNENNWTATEDNLPKYSKGEKITYSWKEDNLTQGYTLTKTETNDIKDEDGKVKRTSTTFTNSRKPELTEATVKKVWDDANDKDKKRPTKLIVELSNGKEVTLNKDNDWTATVDNLPKYSKGKEITYTWTEKSLPEGYTLTDTKTTGKVTTLTNTHEPDKIEKDKTATDLDENYESTVTLSIPGEEKVEDYDVVFVLDKSASANDEVTRVITEYIDTISKNNASIKTGIVSFYNIVEPVKKLNKEKIDIDKLKNATGNGTNLAAGIQYGTKMLDDDGEVPADHKYLIVISDGDTHVFNQNNKVDGTPTVVLDKSGNNYVAGPGAYERKYGSYNPPADWDEYFVEIAKLVNSDGTSYQTPWAHKSNNYNAEVNNGTANGYIDEGKLSEHACTVDTALYYAYENYKSAQNKRYNTYAVGIDSNRYYGPSFMDYLNGGKRLNLGDLVKTVYYIPAGSYVTDIMGEGKDAQGNDYNFDFVNELEKIDIILNDQKLAKVEKEDENGNKYFAFGDEIEDKDGNKYYPFTVVYDAEKDSFTWHFNINLTVYDNIKLVYKVKLTNPQEEPGEYTNLKTNKKATITTPDGEYEFPKPEVEYKVVEKTNITVTKVWDDNNSENRPDSITLQIKADDKLYKEVVLNSENVTLKKVDEKDAWEYVMKLPKYKTDEDGNETTELINYAVEETKIGDAKVKNNAALAYTTETIIDPDSQSEDDKKVTIKNTLETIDIKVKKEWITKNATTNKPKNLTVKLMNGKTVVERAVLDEDNGWSCEFKGEDKRADGEIINYTVEEESVEGFYQSDLDKNVDEDGNVTYKLTNSPSIEIEKESETDGKTIEVGENITYTVTVTNKNDIDEVTNLQESIPENTELVGKIEINSTGKNKQTTDTMPREITVPANGKTTITFTVEVQNSALGTGNTITNTAKVGKNDKMISSDTIKNNAQKELKIYQVETENQGQTVVVVIDMSLSMASAINPVENSDTMAYAYNETRWYYLTDALDKFIDKFLSNPNNKISIVGYNENATKLCDFTNNKNTAKNSYKDVFTQTHFNNLQKAAACGNEAFNAQKQGAFKNDLSSNEYGYNIDVDALTYLGTGKWNKTVNVGHGPDSVTYTAGQTIPGATGTTECLLASGTNITKGLSTANSELSNDVIYTSVVLMTDGEANRDQGGESANAAAIKAKGADLYTIGFTSEVQSLESTVGSSNITKSYTANTATQLSNAFGDIAGKITNLPVVTKNTTTGTVNLNDITIKNDSDIEIVAKVNGKETKLFNGTGSSFKSEYMTGNSFNYKKLLENKNADPDAEIVMTINTNV